MGMALFHSNLQIAEQHLDLRRVWQEGPNDPTRCAIRPVSKRMGSQYAKRIAVVAADYRFDLVGWFDRGLDNHLADIMASADERTLSAVAKGRVAFALGGLDRARDRGGA